MAQRPDGRPNRSQPVSFSRSSAERIAKAVRKFEEGDRSCEPLKFSAGNRAAMPTVFRVASFGTATWDKGDTATVTFLTVTTTPNTATAVNLFADIASGGTGRSCAIARDGTAWYLIAAECE
jgi:hypothetical protein